MSFSTNVQALWEAFVASDDVLPAIEAYQAVLKILSLNNEPCITYSALKTCILPHLNYKAKTFFANLDKKFENSVSLSQLSNVAENTKAHLILISGGGPCGLRAAAELALLGHSVRLIELRSEVSRHNILKTWKQTFDDLLGFGLSAYVPSLKLHGHLHLGTREIQLCLIKFCLLAGVQLHFGRGICGLIQPTSNDKSLSWKVWTLPTAEARIHLGKSDFTSSSSSEAEVMVHGLKPSETDTSRLDQTSKVDFYEKAESDYGAVMEPAEQHESVEYFNFDTLLVAEGESSRLIRRLGFDRKVAKYNEAIGIVVNLDFSPRAFTKEGLSERQLPEFVVWRAAADWKQGPLGVLDSQGLSLENMEYMRGTRTHFIAATTKVKALVEIGVLQTHRPSVKQSLSGDNIDSTKAKNLARLLASTAKVPDECPLSAKHGVQIFDFSCKGLCVHCFRYLSSSEKRTQSSGNEAAQSDLPEALILPVGDALQNPYWPQGLGVNRGFHSALDAVWVAHGRACGWTEAQVMEERQHSFRTMEWLSFTQERVKSGSQWTADPLTRYHLDIQKSMHMHDIQKTGSQLPQRYQQAISGLK